MAKAPDRSPLPDMPSFGRRRGRTFSAHQSMLLDRLLGAPDFDLAAPAPETALELFRRPVHEVWLEIGFGGGEHLLWQARNNPDIGFIAAEPFLDGVVKVLSGMDTHGLDNILTYPNDVRPLLRWLPATSISKTFILFPDPWPKKRHLKRRLVSPATLELLARVMPPGCELRIATDIGDYGRTILLSIFKDSHFAWQADSARDWRERSADWPATRYEQKAAAAGRPASYFRFLRK